MDKDKQLEQLIKDLEYIKTAINKSSSLLKHVPLSKTLARIGLRRVSY